VAARVSLHRRETRKHVERSTARAGFATDLSRRHFEKHALRFRGRNGADHNVAFIAHKVRFLAANDWKDAPTTLGVAVVCVRNDDGNLAVHTMIVSGPVR
jgi:hypothetical protein